MFNRRYALFAILLLVAIAAVGAFGIMAQDDDSSDDDTSIWPGFGRGMMNGSYGPGMMGGFGFMDGEEPMMLQLAEILGMEFEDFWLAMRSGQTLDELAAANDVPMDDVYAAMTLQMASHMAQLVDAGTITQEQANARLTWMQENLESMHMFGAGGMNAAAGTGIGPCWQDPATTPQSGMGRGRMRGRGRFGGA